MKKRRTTEWTFMRVNIFVIAVASAVLLVGSVIFSNLPLGGHLYTVAIPGKPSPFFGGFRPENRTRIVAESYAELKDEPIYFSLAVPPFFQSAIIRMEYLNLGQPIIELGARTSLDEWTYALQPIEADIDALDGLSVRKSFLDELVMISTPRPTSDGWMTSETSFDFSTLAVDTHGDVQMIVSLPGMKITDAPVLVRNIQIEYVRPPLTLPYLVNVLRKRLSL